MKTQPVTAIDLLTYFPQTVFTFICDVHKSCKEHEPFTKTVYSPQDFKKTNSETYGVFFTVNGFSSGRRIKTDLTILNAVFGDLDVTKDEAKSNPEERDEKKRILFKKLREGAFPPNFIIITKNGLQPIWILADASLSDEQRATNVCEGIRRWSLTDGCLGDPVKDVCRILRLPGYLHKKSDPYLIKAFQLHDERTKLKDLEEEYKYFDDAVIFNEDNEVYMELGTLDAVSMRDIVFRALPQSNLGVATVSFDPEGRIITDRLTAAYIGRHGDREYVASTGKIPAGNKITFVRKLFNLTDNKEAYKWIAETFQLKTKKIKPIVTSLAPLNERSSKIDSSVRYKSGFEILDRESGGFRLANTYLIGGLEKSGKSSLLATFINQFLKDGIPCGFIDTELSYEEFCRKMTSNFKNESSVTIEQIDSWKQHESDRLQYAGAPDISTDGILNFEKTLATAEFMAKRGAKIIVFDNLTSFFFTSSQKAGWETLGNAITQTITFSKISGTCVFVVAHSKQEAAWVETPENVKKIIEKKEPWKIFEDSHVSVRRPQLADILGGSAAKSQLSGSILLWRPFQKEQDESMRSYSAIVVESFRHSAFSGLIRVDFNGACSSFSESYYQSFRVKT